MTNPQNFTILTMYVTPDASGQPVFNYVGSPGTLDLANVIAYYQFVDPNGTVSLNTSVLMAGTGLPVIVDMDYSAFDAIINP